MASAPFRVLLHTLLVVPNIPAGMDGGVALGFVKMLRTTNEDWDPILVRREGEFWRIIDGRHRFVASLIAGRKDILAVEES